MLLRKSLDLQTQEGDAQGNAMSGKGAVIDIRV